MLNFETNGSLFFFSTYCIQVIFLSGVYRVAQLQLEGEQNTSVQGNE